MKRYRYEWVVSGNVQHANTLLAQGWRPTREVPVGRAPAASECGDVLVVLERDDAFPMYRGEMLIEGVTLEFLNDMDLLAGLNEGELREIIAACEWGRYTEGTILFNEGSSDQRLYMIVEGAVSIQLLGLPIDDPIVLEALPQDVFGESTFFAAGTHSTRAQAMLSTRTLELTRAKYDELLQGQRSAAYKIAVNAARILGNRLQATDQWVREILQGEQSAEIARSWRRFRKGFLDRSGSTSSGFIRV